MSSDRVTRSSRSPPRARAVGKPAPAPPAPAPKSKSKATRPADAKKPVAPKPGNLLLHALYMTSIGVFQTKSTVNPAWRPNLKQPFTAYALSSLFYTVAGLMTVAASIRCPLAFLPGWLGMTEAVLVTLQGVWSYASDVLFIGTDSVVHPIDRFSAVALTYQQVYKFLFVYRTAMSDLDIAWIGATFAVAFACKIADYQAMKSDSISFYRRSHFWWHVSLPLGCGSHLAYRWATATECIEAEASPWYQLW